MLTSDLFGNKKTQTQHKQDVSEGSKELPQWKKDWYAKQKPNSWPKHPQPYHNPNWIDELSPEERKKLKGEKGVAEGDMYGDQEVSWEKGGRRAPTGAFRNPNAEKMILHPDTYELIDEYIAKIEPDADREEIAKSIISGHIHTSELEYALQDEDLNEFAPPGSGDDDGGFDENTLKRLAAQWWHGDEDPRVEKTLAAAGWEIGQDEGYDNGGVFVVRAGDENGRTYTSWPAEELEGLSESYPKHQDLSGISTDKLKAYLAKQAKQSVPGEGAQVKRVKAELQRREQGVAEGEKSPMAKDAQRADRIRSLKNLIAIAQEQGRQLRVQELELELKKLQGVTEMDKSAPQPGRDGRVSHSTYGSRDKGGSKGTERASRPITAKKAAQHALDILKKQGVAEGNQVNEISDRGLQNYRRQAHYAIQGHKFGSMKDAPNAAAIIAKREKGMQQASDKIVARKKAEDDKRLAVLVAKLPELKAEYEQMQAKYKSLGGSNWQYADREQNLSASEREARSMEGPMNNLWRQIQAAEKAQGTVEEGVAEGAEIEATLAKIAAAGDDGYEMIYDGLNGLLGGQVQIILQDMYDDVSRENRLHPDDGYEQIIDRMMDHIESDYGLAEEWSEKYKRSIDCSNPRGFSQKAHCAGRNKNESEELTEQDLEEAVSTLELADFLFKGLEQKFPKIIQRYGHEVVGNAIMDVAEENRDVSSVSEVDMLIDDIIEKLQNYNSDATNLSEAKVSRLYYNVVGTSERELRKEFGMRHDRRGWFLSESSGRNRIMDAQRAFGSPKLVEYDLAAGNGSAATLGPDNVISPIGTVPKGQRINTKKSRK